MDTHTYTAWREERLQKKKETHAHIRELEDAKKREAEAAAIPVVVDIAAPVLEPVQPMVVASIAAIHVISADSTVDVPVVDVQLVHDNVAAEDDSKPRTVSPEGGRMIRHRL